MLNTKTGKQSTDLCLKIVYVQKYKFCILQEMEGVEASAEDGSHHNNLDNIYVELNNQPYELIQTIKSLKDELQTVKEDNERILWAHEELNHILLDKLLNEWKDKTKECEYDSGAISYKLKGKKLKFLYNESNFSSEIKVRSHREKHKYSSESSDSDNSPKKRKYIPYKENFKRF